MRTLPTLIASTMRPVHRLITPTPKSGRHLFTTPFCTVSYIPELRHVRVSSVTEYIIPTILCYDPHTRDPKLASCHSRH